MSELISLQNWAQANVETALFYCLAVIAIPLAYGVVFDRVVIRAGFLLIGVFGAISGLFMILQAQFLAMAQIIIYAVAITLVVVIALMLTNPRLERELTPALAIHRLPGVGVAFLVFMTIYMSARAYPGWPVSNEPMQADNVRLIGSWLMTVYSLPFEFASVLLLAALVGAVMLAKAQRVPPVRAERPGDEKGVGERSNDVVKV